MSSSQYVLVFDVGTTMLKAAVFNRQGECIAKSKTGLALSTPQKGWAEQNADEWWQAAIAATDELHKSKAFLSEEIKAISVCAQMCGTVPINDQGVALSPALIWLDTRSSDIAKKLMKGLIKVSGYGLWALLKSLYVTNGAPNLSGKDPISKILWYKHHRPEIWQQTDCFLDVKDFMLNRLTGQQITTPDCAHLTWLMDSKTNKWSNTILNKTGIPQDKVPEIVNPTDSVGSGLTGEAANLLGLPINTPVIAGLGDITAISLASGAIESGAPNISAGTGSWCAAHYDKRKVDPWTAIGTIRAANPDRYVLAAAQETAGASIEKTAEWLGLVKNAEPDVRTLFEYAEKSETGAKGILFLPWLFGERCPVDDLHLRGGLLNLTLEHQPEDIARAAIEGVCLNIKWASEHLFRNAKTTADQGVRLLGGLSESDLFCQTMADTLNRTIIRNENPVWAGATGAAICAATGIGWLDSIEESSEWVKIDKSFAPMPAQAKLMSAKFKAFKSAWRSNKNWFRRINTYD